jgi:hypothetical protein
MLNINDIDECMSISIRNIPHLYEGFFFLVKLAFAFKKKTWREREACDLNAPVRSWA